MAVLTSLVHLLLAAMEEQQDKSFHHTAQTNGRIGIGVVNPSYTLHVYQGTDGDTFAIQDFDGLCTYDPESGSVTVACSSDERLKKNITDLTNLGRENT